MTSDPSPGSSPPGVVAANRADWFEAEVQPHEGHLRSFLRGAYPALRDVDDVVQESYLRIWSTHAIKPIRSARAFLFQVARNLALDLLRRKIASPVKGVSDLAALTIQDDAPDPAAVACSREEIALLARALHSLPPRCREITVLRKIQRMPQKEIAARLGLSEQTVQVQVLRGVKKIDEYLRLHGLESPVRHETRR
ncbi:MAG: sigma-70 family RNA polymerase sigma factor [Opitutaceae bacterium]|nr:sigma-70 family RNA polymerase sigma factor [Opitutaceae bacterium]